MSTTENKFFVILFFFTIVVCAPILSHPMFVAYGAE